MSSYTDSDVDTISIHSSVSWGDPEYDMPVWSVDELDRSYEPFEDPDLHFAMNLGMMLPIPPALLHPEGYYDYPPSDYDSDEELWEAWHQGDLHDVWVERRWSFRAFYEPCLEESIPYWYFYMSYLLYRVLCPPPASEHLELVFVERCAVILQCSICTL